MNTTLDNGSEQNTFKRFIGFLMIALFTGPLTPISALANPADQPRFQMSQMVYKGAFRLDNTTVGESNLSYANRGIGLNPDNNSLFIVVSLIVF